jgi:transcriptional regulator with XRE-family HTH domain
MGHIRADVLGLTQREFAEVLTESSGELISATRISDAERGMTNLCTDFAKLWLKYLETDHADTYGTLILDTEFAELVARLPDTGMSHRENQSPGNTYDGPRAPAVAKVNRKRTVAQAPVVTEQELLKLIYQDGKLMVVMVGGVTITVELDA